MIWASLLKLAVLGYLGIGLTLYLFQRNLIYFPVPERESDGYAAEWFALADARLKVWVVHPGEKDAVVYFGGNAEDVIANAGYLERHLGGRTVYLVNYRGYGGSDGSPTQVALFADALGLFDRLRARHGRIDVVGRSLGSAVAVYLASERPVRRLALVTPFDSVLALARRYYPVFPARLLLKDRYESVGYAPAVTAPTLVLIAEHDRIVPGVHSRRLAEAMHAAEVRLFVLRGVGHNGLAAHPDYWSTIAGFLSE